MIRAELARPHLNDPVLLILMTCVETYNKELTQTEVLKRWH